MSSTDSIEPVDKIKALAKLHGGYHIHCMMLSGYQFFLLIGPLIDPAFMMRTQAA